MKIEVVYCFPLINVRTYFPLAMRFAETYHRFPAGVDHQFAVLFNGRQPTSGEARMFDNIPHGEFIHDNTGWDIGAFQRFADISTADMLVCFGSPVHFHQPNWLRRMADAMITNGPGLFGCSAYQAPDYHIRTTSFWFPPELLRSYPFYVGSSRSSRYEFEHGHGSFTRHVMQLGFPCLMVTWRGEFPVAKWGVNPYIPWSDGAPSANDILVRDQHIHA